jgi:hypothetical protein
MDNDLDKNKSLKDLMEDLNSINSVSNEEYSAAEESLDLVVDQALSGIDIRKLFPKFFNYLLRSKKLREQFLDALALSGSTNEIDNDPYLNNLRPDLSFLQHNQPQVSSWPVFLTQNRVQIINLFFPKQATYRRGTSLGSAAVYTLLRKDFTLSETTYSIRIDSELSNSPDEALITYLSLATNNDQSTAFPINVSMRWGEYSAELSLQQEGKQKLPDIPLADVFTPDLSRVKADLFLTITPIAC